MRLCFNEGKHCEVRPGGTTAEEGDTKIVFGTSNGRVVVFQHGAAQLYQNQLFQDVLSFGKSPEDDDELFGTRRRSRGGERQERLSSSSSAPMDLSVTAIGVVTLHRSAPEQQ